LRLILFVIFPVVALLSGWAASQRQQSWMIGVICAYYATALFLDILLRAGKPSSREK
jgi:hypothetical protein